MILDTMNGQTLDNEGTPSNENASNGESNSGLLQVSSDDDDRNDAETTVATTTSVQQAEDSPSTLMDENSQHVNHQVDQHHPNGCQQECEQQKQLDQIQESQKEMQIDQQQQQQAVCQCVCTCETYEEMNGFGETEDLMQICICSHECSEEECRATRLPAGLSLYALHCCCCGVQLSSMEVCPKEPEEPPDEVRLRQQQQHSYCACDRLDITNGGSGNDSRRNDVQGSPGAARDISTSNKGNNLPLVAQSCGVPDPNSEDVNVSQQSPAPTAAVEAPTTKEEDAAGAPTEASVDVTRAAAAVAAPPPPPPPPPPQGSIPSRVNIVPLVPLLALNHLRALSSDAGSPNDSRLHEAARAGRADLIESLLQDPQIKRNINSRVKPFMSTPLREAVVSGSTMSVAALLRGGADVDGVDVKGQTPLFLAACLNQPVIMELLLAAGADPEGSRYNNCTPLLICVREGTVEGVQALLRHGADPQPLSLLTTCVPGWPLQHCVVYRRYHCFLALLRGGAEPSLARVLARRDRAMAARALDTEGLDPAVLHRLSIVRTALRYASDRPEFVLAYREFGGAINPGDLATSQLGEQRQGELQLEPCAAGAFVAAALEAPSSLLSLCRVALLRVVGAPRMEELAYKVGLPSSLRAYLAYTDLDKLGTDEEDV